MQNILDEWIDAHSPAIRLGYLGPKARSPSVVDGVSVSPPMMTDKRLLLDFLAGALSKDRTSG